MRLRNIFLIPLLLLVSSLSADTAQEVPQIPGYHVIQIVPDNPTPAYKREKRYLEKTEQKWAKVFHIETWAVEVYPVPFTTLQQVCAVPCMAASDWNPYLHTGVIFVLQESDYSTRMKAELRKEHISIKSDQRNSVVHEILHNVVEHMNEEIAVQILTNLLHP